MGRLPTTTTTRRRFLRGIGGTGMALPFLEIFARKAHAASQVSRYVFMFGGFSIGSSPNNRIAPVDEGQWSPAFPVTPALQPLDDFGVSDLVSMVSGLSIPAASTPPAGGRPPDFHSTSHQVLATGQRYTGGQLPGVSSDWLAADTLAGDTLQKVLTYRAQPSFYRVNSEGLTDGIISARHNEAGALEQVAPVTSPRLAYESLFEGFIPPDPQEALAAQRALAMRKSVVDLVADDAEGLLGRLGREDTVRMQRHFDELRTLENRLNAIEPPAASACAQFGHPGDDPPIGDGIDPSGGGDYNDHYKNANGYSNEELRATIMTDLIHMAFACDISRVASFMVTYAQCFMNMYTELGLPTDLHEITHGSVGGGDQMQDALGVVAAWHLKHFSRLVQKLRDTEDLDGSSMIDNTALAFAFEGGWGLDATGAGGDDSPHSTENMCVLLAGKAGGLHRMTPGRHIDGAGRHPTAVLNTALRATGVQETLGEVPGLIDELLE